MKCLILIPDSYILFDSHQNISLGKNSSKNYFNELTNFSFAMYFFLNNWCGIDDVTCKQIIFFKIHTHTWWWRSNSRSLILKSVYTWMSTVKSYEILMLYINLGSQNFILCFFFQYVLTSNITIYGFVYVVYITIYILFFLYMYIVFFFVSYTDFFSSCINKKAVYKQKKNNN